jgi:hypothetical protein
MPSYGIAVCPVCDTPFARRKPTSRYCSVACLSATRNRPLNVRLWECVNKDGPIPMHRPDLGPCWIWTGKLTFKGYGSIYPGADFIPPRRTIATHRASWLLHYGEIPIGLWILHHCDNPPCIRPTHLFLGTAADNTRDMLAKGRAASGERAGLRLHPESILRGEAHQNAKLKEPDIIHIRQLAANGICYADIAPMFGIARSTVGSIVQRRIWKHV